MFVVFSCTASDQLTLLFLNNSIMIMLGGNTISAVIMPTTTDLQDMSIKPNSPRYCNVNNRVQITD